MRDPKNQLAEKDIEEVKGIITKLSDKSLTADQRTDLFKSLKMTAICAGARSHQEMFWAPQLPRAPAQKLKLSPLD